MTDDLAAFLDAAEARAAVAFAPCGEPGHTGHGLECRIEKGWPYNVAPVHEAIALAADVPALVGMVRAVLAVKEWVESQGGPLGQDAAFYDANVRAALLSAIPPTPTEETQ